MLAEESAELLKLGTCRYLMELNDEWENMLSNNGYEEFTGCGGELQETITMESILFCKHGGFIYPIDPGYIVQLEPYEVWSNIVDSVAQWYVKNISTYCHMTRQDIINNGGPSTDSGRKGYDCNMDGNLDGLKVFDDCSGFIWACLVQAGYFDSSQPISVSGEYLPEGSAAPLMEEAGFSWHSKSEIKAEDLQQGDILVRNGHIEVFKEFDAKGVEWAWTWGDQYSQQPIFKKKSEANIFSGKDAYQGVWRIEDGESED